MNIISYVDQFGNQSFKDRPFSDIDAVILSQLSYLNFDIYGQRDDKNPIYLKDIPHEMFEPLSRGEFTKRKNIILLTKLKSSVRFRNVGISFVRHSQSVMYEEQFFAITCILPNGDFYMAYRGTDLTLVGWKEDANMAFLDVVPSQQSALEFAQGVTSKLKGRFYIGGHSKGGNLSFFSLVNLSPEKIERCIQAYSFDGPGFFDQKYEEIESLKSKMTKIVPQNTIVGIMLSTLKNCKIVYSPYVGIFQHDPYSWQIDKKTIDFVYRKRRSSESYINERALYTWLRSLSKDDKVFAANALFMLMGGLDLDLKEFITFPKKRIRNIMKIRKEATDEEKEKFLSIFKQLIYHHRRARNYYLKNKKAIIAGNM